MGHDLRLAARRLGAAPGFTAAAVLSLALGIGANAAVFSVVHALLLAPLPFYEPDRLVQISSVRGDEVGPLTVPEQDDLAGLTRVIEDIALFTDQGMYNASGFGTPEELPATITTHNLFQVLGIQPRIGQTFPADHDRTRQFGLVISHALWQRRFDSDPHIVGQTMTLDGAPGYVIHGVLPPGVTFPADSDLLRSSGISPIPASYQRRDVRQRHGLARLVPGVSIAQAQRAVDDLAVRLATEYPDSNAGVSFRVTPLRDAYVQHFRGYLWLLAAAVTLVFVVAVANVANLMVARALDRRRDLAVRVALGASRGHLIRESLADSLLLAIGGALRLIRSGGHVPKGGYDVQNGTTGRWPASAPAVL